MVEVRRLLARGKAHHGRFLAGAACALLAAPFGAIAPLLIEGLVDHVNRALELHERGILYERMALFAALIPVVMLAKGAVTYGATYLVASGAQSVLADLRAALFRTLVERPISFLAERASGDLVSHVTNDVQRIELGLSTRLADLLINVPLAVASTLYLWATSWHLALVVTVLLPGAALLVRRLSKRIKSASRKGLEHTGSMAAVLGEVLGGMRVVKAYQAEAHERARFGALNDSLRRANLRARRTMAMSSPILEALGGFLIAFLIGLATWQIVRGGMEPEEVVGFLGGMSILYQAMKKVTQAHNELQLTTAAAQRCFALLDAALAAQEPTGRRDVTGLARAIELRHVSFSYAEAPVLRDVSFVARRGEVVALVGESGSGKSTLLDLLLRFREPTSGAILWDGVDLREVTPRSLRSQVALVTQDAVVFDDTVARNIAYGDPAPDMDRVIAAARAAHAHDFVTALEQGYETRLGERGCRLSGGQRQRITVARAVYKDAPVWILDEATSALDSQSEQLLQEGLAHLMVGRTVFVVAHRLATVKQADRIVVLADGRIVQEGTHEELLERHGTYRELHRLQLGGA
jgi:ABC-type multidrug transport system fused ATPase/permease subunit